MPRKPPKTPWWEKKEKPVRHREDDLLRSEVAGILGGLPSDHPAIQALTEGVPTLEILRMIYDVEEDEITQRIRAAYDAWSDRDRATLYSHFSPWPRPR